MRDNHLRKEQGSVEVEATFILPLAILSVCLLLYLSLFMFQKANLQSALETCVVYYKNCVTDDYVKRNDGGEVTFSTADSSKIGAGNSYSADEVINPYGGKFGDSQNLNNQEAFQKYFNSVAGHMLFSDNLEIKVYYKNGILSDKFEATAVQTVELPLDFSFIGIEKNTYQIWANAKVAVVDHDQTMRNIDFAIDLVSDTKLADFALKFKDKVSEVYGKITSTLGLKAEGE